MNKRPPAKKPQAKIQTVKKEIPVKKIAPDRIEELVKKHLGNIGEAENAFKSVSALLEKHKTKYPELEQYIEHVSASDRSIQILENIKDPRRAHYIFKILLTGVQPAYQVAHPGEKDHTNVDRAAWISTFEEALAKAIVQIVLSRQAEQASQAVGSPKNRIPTPSRFLGFRSRSEIRIPTPEGVLPLQRKESNLLHHLAVQVSSQFSRLGNQMPVTAED